MSLKALTDTTNAVHQLVLKASVIAAAGATTAAAIAKTDTDAASATSTGGPHSPDAAEHITNVILRSDEAARRAGLAKAERNKYTDVSQDQLNFR